MTGFPASAWPDADLSAVGLGPAGQDLSVLSQTDLAHRINAAKNAHAYLDWLQFELALAVYDRVYARAAEQKMTGIDLKTIDLEAQIVLCLQQYLEGTEYQGRMLMEDAHAARYRLPACAGLLRTGVIDRRRFHRLVLATELVDDPVRLALIDQQIAAELRGLAARGTALSEGQTTELATRHLLVLDPDGARRRRDHAKKRRGIRTRTLDDGLAELTVVATAEDVRLAAASIDAVVAGLCRHDPRTTSEQRSAAAIARQTGRPFGCECGRDDCTARVDVTAIDERAARIVIHAICDSAALTEPGPDPTNPDPANRDRPGYLDGHGPISAEHARELAARGDAVVRRHDLDALCDTDTDTDRIDAEFARIVDAARRHGDLDELAAAAAAAVGTDWAAIEAAAHAHFAPLDSTLAAASRRISHTAQPADPYRPTALTDLLCRFLWATCSVPGCERPAFACDLDHVCEYDPPARGMAVGPTCPCNLLPKCRYHHLMKTFLDGFLDELWIDADGRYRSAMTLHGITTSTAAPNQWLFPTLALLRCRHENGHIGRPPPNIWHEGPDRVRTRVRDKHARRRAERQRNRRAREAESQTAHETQLRRIADELADRGRDEPPF